MGTAEQRGTIPFSEAVFRPCAISASGLRLARRAGLTLVELLVTITIIAILAAIFLGALQLATEDAKVMKTRSMIVKLNNLIMPRYEAYRTRACRSSSPQRRIQRRSIQGVATPKQAPTSDALHELMRLEMPDRWSDVLDPPMAYAYPPAYPPASPKRPSTAKHDALTSRPAVSQGYYNAYQTRDGITARPTSNSARSVLS